jgi:hypothetical protein
MTNIRTLALTFILLATMAGFNPALAGGQNMTEDTGIQIWAAKELPMTLGVTGLVRAEIYQSRTEYDFPGLDGSQYDFNSAGIGFVQINLDMNRRNNVEMHWKFRVSAEPTQRRLGVEKESKMRIEEAGYDAQWGPVDLKGYFVGRIPFGSQSQSFVDEREFLDKSDVALEASFDRAVMLFAGSTIGDVSFLVGGGLENDFEDDLNRGTDRGNIFAGRVTWTVLGNSSADLRDGLLNNNATQLRFVASFANDNLGDHLALGASCRAKRWAFQGEMFRGRTARSFSSIPPVHEQAGAYVQIVRLVSGFTTGARVSYSRVPDADISFHGGTVLAGDERTELTLHIARNITSGTIRTRAIAEVTGFRSRYRESNSYRDSSGRLALQLSF